MRRFAWVALVVWAVELAALAYSYKWGWGERTRPTLIESHLDVPDPARFAGDEEGFAEARDAVLAARFLTRGENAGLAPNTLIGGTELEALVRAGAGRIPVWDTRLVSEAAALELKAGEEFRDRDGVILARIGQELDFDTLLRMAEAYDRPGGDAEHRRIRVKGTGSIIGFDLTLAFAGANFLLLAWFLHAVLWGPVTRLLDERAQAVREDVASARRRREEAERLHEDAQAEIERIRDGADDVREAARRKGEEERAEIVQDARDEARRTAERTKRAVEAEIERARAAAAGDLGGFSLELASRILGRAVTPEDHERLVREFIEALERSAGPEGGGA